MPSGSKILVDFYDCYDYNYMTIDAYLSKRLHTNGLGGFFDGDGNDDDFIVKHRRINRTAQIYTTQNVVDGYTINSWR